MSEDVLRVDRISKSFKGVAAVREVSFSLSQGEVFAFLGLNGAGKTTTLKMLLGLLKPDSGTISCLGQSSLRVEDRLKIGYMPEMAYYYPFLNFLELMDLYGGLCGMDRKAVRERALLLAEKVGLQEAMRRPLKTYSKGMLQRAGIAQALLHDPQVLILDEPFTGLDPLARIHLRNLIMELKTAGKSILLSSHELSEAELMCDHVAIMKAGRLVLNAEMKSLVGAGDGNLERLFLEVLEKAQVQP